MPCLWKDMPNNMPQPMLYVSCDDSRRQMWWACMRVDKLRNYDTATGKHHIDTIHTPQYFQVFFHNTKPSFDYTTLLTNLILTPISQVKSHVRCMICLVIWTMTRICAVISNIIILPQRIIPRLFIAESYLVAILWITAIHHPHKYMREILVLARVCASVATVSTK